MQRVFTAAAYTFVFLGVLAVPASAAEPVPAPAKASSARNQSNLAATIPPGGTLLAAACPNARDCVSVGDNETRFGPRRLAEVLHRDWAFSVTAPFRAPGGALLNDISCPSTTFCAAVGSYYGRSGRSGPLIEAWNGSHWKVLATPAQRARGILGAALTGVSCPSARTCVAVGNSSTAAGPVPLAEHWNGTRWKIQRVVVPGRVRGSVFDKISCAASNSCVGVGYYIDRQSRGFALAEGWNGVHWRIQPAVGVPGAQANVLSGVSCWAVGRCIAVGNYSGATNGILAEIWNGAVWLRLSAPSPAASPVAALTAVACRSARLCEAVGYSQVGAMARYTTLAEGWNGGIWTIQATPGRGPASELYSVNCPAARDCLAVGGYASHASVRKTLALAWNGTRWQVELIPGD